MYFMMVFSILLESLLPYGELEYDLDSEILWDMLSVFFQRSSRINHFVGTIGLTELTNICKGAELIKMDHLMDPAAFLKKLEGISQ